MKRGSSPTRMACSETSTSDTASSSAAAWAASCGASSPRSWSARWPLVGLGAGGDELVGLDRDHDRGRDAGDRGEHAADERDVVDPAQNCCGARALVEPTRNTSVAAIASDRSA